MKNYLALIQTSDPSLYDGISTALSIGDRRSLLTLQNIVRQFRASYTYLEVGSEWGASLLPHLKDPFCLDLFSIDLRVLTQPDERGTAFDFAQCSTAKMLKGLEPFVTKCEIDKLKTFDSDIKDVPTTAIGRKVRFGFIDGEHTNKAAFRDFVKLYRLLETDGIIAFHDANLIFDAIQNAETMLEFLDVRYYSAFLADVVCVIGFGKLAEILEQELATAALDRDRFICHARHALNIEIARNTAPICGSE